MENGIIEFREFSRVNGKYKLYGKITNNDINLYYCKLYGIDPNTVDGLKNEETNID